MRAIDIQNIIDNTDYWDEQVKSVECSYFSDEVLIAFDKVKLLFKNAMVLILVMSVTIRRTLMSKICSH